MQQKSQTSTLMQSLRCCLSNIAGYNLAQDKIMYIWDVQRRGQAIKAENERKKRLEIEAALASRVSRSKKIIGLVKLIGWLIIKTHWFQDLFHSLVLRRTQQ